MLGRDASMQAELRKLIGCDNGLPKSSFLHQSSNVKMAEWLRRVTQAKAYLRL
jgi:hypothetical protein